MKSTLPKNSIIADSGFWIALANRKDRHHEAALEALVQHESLVFVVTWPVITEACHLIHSRVNLKAQLLFIDNLAQGGADIYHLDNLSQLKQMQKLMIKYRDLPMDLADASLVLLAEELGHGRILSTDQRDFNAYRWKQHEPFQNLLITD
jgi:predicted nucleic acid-binding protein